MVPALAWRAKCAGRHDEEGRRRMLSGGDVFWKSTADEKSTDAGGLCLYISEGEGKASMTTPDPGLVVTRSTCCGYKKIGPLMGQTRLTETASRSFSLHRHTSTISPRYLFLPVVEVSIACARIDTTSCSAMYRHENKCRRLQSTDQVLRHGKVRTFFSVVRSIILSRLSSAAPTVPLISALHGHRSAIHWVWVRI